MNRNFKSTLLLATAIIGVTAAFVIGEKTSNNFNCELAPHTVQQGDTLWGIAESKCEGDIQRVTDNLVDTYGTNIQIGQNIYLPEHENCELRLTDGGQVIEECD
jgi:hypothetical protein